MIYYLNMGFVLEQALRDVVKTYLDRLRLDEVYGNFHISVVNDHPFAHMIIDQNARCSDNFPAVVITSQSDNKIGEMANVPPQLEGIGMTSKDIDDLIASATQPKTKINENGVEVAVVKKGVVQTERVPGYVLVTDEETINKLKDIADSRTKAEENGMVYGLRYTIRRRDHVSIEIWAENNQLKNEIYEHLRILFAGSFERLLQEKYSGFDIAVWDNTLSGERSSNYNFDFDTLLCGSHIAFDVDYNVSQIILDTEIEDINYQLITEVINHVKE